MSTRGRSQNFQTLFIYLFIYLFIFFFLHIFIALLCEAHFIKGIELKQFQYEMRAIFTESLVHETLSNTVAYLSVK